MKSFKKLTFNTLEEIHFLAPNDIVRILGDGSYCHIFSITGNRITISKSLSKLENILLNPIFFRTHQSHIVNLNHICKVLKTQGDIIKTIDGGEVHLSRSKKKDFFAIIMM